MVERKLEASFGAQSDTYSAQTSTGIRALALATIGVAWLFLSGTQKDPDVTVKLASHQVALLVALLLGVLSLLADVFQYVVGFLLWQRLQEVYDFLFGDLFEEPNAAKRQVLWSRANKYGFFQLILDSTGKNTQALKNNAEASRTEVEKVLTQFNPKPSQPLPPQTTTALSPARISALSEELDANRSPQSFIRAVNRFFWSKVLFAVGSAASVAIFIIFSIF